MNNEEIIRYLIKVKIYASLDGETVVVKESEHETNSHHFNLPTFRLFADGVTFSQEIEILKKRYYKKSHSNAGMIELDREEDV